MSINKRCFQDNYTNNFHFKKMIPKSKLLEIICFGQDTLYNE